MIQEPSTTKKYLLTITVDEEQLIKSYTGNDNTINRKDLPDTDALLAFELNWIASSGVQVVEIEEMEE